MRRFLPQTLPSGCCSSSLPASPISQIATLYIVSRDRAATNDVVDLYRLNNRAFSSGAADARRDARRTQSHGGSGLFDASYALTVSDTPAVTSSIAGDDELAELEDIPAVGRLSKFGITDARVRRDPATREADDAGGAAAGPDIGQMERDLLVLAADFAQSEKLTASLRFADGQWLNFTEPRTPVGPVLSFDSLPLYGLIAGLVVIMSIWSLRRLTAPYRMMETAVTRIGNDLKSPPIAETGSREIRAAAMAVNAMQARLRDYVEDREHLAAALAHDLRTPLTRMRLRLELLRKSPAREALAHDLADIESIASSVIDFATFEVTEEKSERIDFWSLVEAIADGFEDVSFDGDGTRSRGLICIARPVALKRCVTNLVQNAITYGKRAHLSLRQSGRMITLAIRDEGPGIPQAQLDAVFGSYVRLEQSRNRQTGGLGLGLTIARNIARGIGGEVSLSNHPGGGLLTELRLPLAG